MYRTKKGQSRGTSEITSLLQSSNRHRSTHLLVREPPTFRPEINRIAEPVSISRHSNLHRVTESLLQSKASTSAKTRKQTEKNQPCEGDKSGANRSTSSTSASVIPNTKNEEADKDEELPSKPSKSTQKPNKPAQLGLCSSNAPQTPEAGTRSCGTEEAGLPNDNTVDGSEAKSASAPTPLIFVPGNFRFAYPSPRGIRMMCPPTVHMTTFAKQKVVYFNPDDQGHVRPAGHSTGMCLTTDGLLKQTSLPNQVSPASD